MIFSWKLQLDYDLLVLGPHSVRTATKLWYRCTPAIFLRCSLSTPSETYMEIGKLNTSQ